MNATSHLRRPVSGPFAGRSNVTDRQLSDGQSDKSSSPSSSPRGSITYSPTLARSSKMDSPTPKRLFESETASPRSRISSALSKFERLDQNSKYSTKPKTTNDSAFNLNNNSSSLSSGNKFLNGRTLNSVTNNRFSLGSNEKKSTSSRISLMPSSLRQKQGTAKFASKLKNNEGSDIPKRIMKKEEKDQLLKKLTPMQYRVTQEKVTERPYSNKYYKHWDTGSYSCVVCGEEIFQSHTKYDSGSGWPAFYDVISWDKIALKQDLSHVGANLLLLVCNPSLARTEVSCRSCNSHIGHVFDDGPKPTGQRFCVNSASLSFKSNSSDSSFDQTDSEPEKCDPEKQPSGSSCADTIAPLVHMASPGNSCSLGARLCFRVPSSMDACEGPVSSS